jgi:tetratricopeptide (TPR) repeat protein
MLAHGLKHTGSGISSPQLSPLARRITTTAFTLILLGVAGGCRPAVVRVPVSPEDLKRANAVALEGDIAYARRDYYAALIKYLEAGRLNPNSEYVFNKVGITYSHLKFYAEAIAAYNRSIGLNPKYPYSYNNLGSVYFASDDKKKAEKYFRKAIGMKGDEATFHVNLGVLLMENKKYEKGLQELRKAVSLDPQIFKRPDLDSLAAASSQKNSTERSYAMARLHASMGNAELAVENLQQALTNGFTNLEAIRTEHDFDPIRQNEKFIAFMKYATQLIKS